MGFRIRKSIKVVPGARLNFGKNGISTSIGKRGAGITFGPTGTTTHVGIPGTGISYVRKLEQLKLQKMKNRISLVKLKNLKENILA